MRNLFKRFLQPSLWFVSSVLVAFIFLVAGASSYLAEEVVKSNLEHRLKMVLRTSHNNLREWINKHQHIVMTIAADPHLVQAITNMNDVSDCLDTCRKEQAVALANLLAGQKARLEQTGYDVELVIVGSGGSYIAGSEGVLADNSALLTQIIKFNGGFNSNNASFYLPRSLPVAFSGHSDADSPNVFFTSPVRAGRNDPVALLLLILNPAQQFSEVISLKNLSQVNTGNSSGAGNRGEPLAPDIYAFNSEGILISVPSLASRLINSGLVNSDKLILNMSIRDPGGNVTDGYQPSRRRDDQNLTRMAASAIRGGAGIDMRGYRNYLGVTVMGTWLWDRHLQMGIAVELVKSEALSAVRTIQGIILFGAFGMAAGLLWINYLVRGRRNELAAEASSIDGRNQSVIESLRDELHAGGMRLEEHRAELEEEIGEKKRFYDQMRSAVGLRKSLMEISSDGVLIIGDDNRLLDINSRFAQLWSLGSELPIDDPGKLEEKVFASMARQLGHRLDEFDLVKSWLPDETGEKIPELLSLRNGRKLNVISMPLPGNVEGDRVLVFREVTDPKSVDNAELQKLMCIEILARGVSHEFNNILSAVFGYVELAQRTLKPGDEVTDDLREILDATKRAQALVQGFLAFSRRANLDDEKIKCSTLVLQALTLVEQVIPLNVSVHKHFPDDEYEVKVNPSKIYQVLLVILFDAIKCMPSGGELHIRISRRGPDRVRLAIADKAATGDKIRTVTGPRQVGAEYQGLLEQREVLQKILGEQGTLEVKSVTGGANRILTLTGAKVSDSLAPEALFEQYASLASGGIVLLLAKDTQAMRPVVQAMENAGYGVLVMDSSLKALEIFREHPAAFSIVISDVTLAGLSGDVLARLVLDQKPDTIVVLCVDPGASVNTDAAGFHGVYRIVQNPLSVSLLSDLFESLSLPPVDQVFSPIP